MGINEDAVELHKKLRGKLEVVPKYKPKTKKDFSMIYTPGVAQPCIEIQASPKKVFDYTMKSNLVGVISDGSAVLGLGNIGAEAAIPVMEGKAVLFKELAGIDAFPICLKTQEVDEIVSIVKNISPVFGGINLEDISAPRCFEIEERLQNLGIPVFHDDQHGTAVIVLAGLINSCKLTNRKLSDLKICISGVGAAGTAIVRMLVSLNEHSDLPSAGEIIVCDSKGIIFEGRENLNSVKQELAKVTNPLKKKGLLSDAIEGCNCFIGVSKPNLLSKEMIKSMEKDSIIFAMANPDPEILPSSAKEAGAIIVATGRSDYPNQINNALVFPAIFRGALDVRAKQINLQMKIAAAKTLASAVTPALEKILPALEDRRYIKLVSDAVKKVAIETGMAQNK